MPSEVMIALIGVLATIAAAIAVVIKRVDVMEWWRARKERADVVDARNESAFDWTRSQLEQEKVKREEDTAAHRASQEGLRTQLESRIFDLERQLVDVLASLQQAHIHSARIQSDVEQLKKERDALTAELKTARDMYTKIISDTHETYTKIISDTFARRVSEEER